jgi:hypothetical protein
MNVVITEIYNDESPVTWVVNREHATPELRAAIDKAILNEGSATCSLWDVGFQGRENESATVSLPAIIDACIELYES